MAKETKAPQEELEHQAQEASAAAEGSREWYEEKVPVRLFKDNGKYKDDVFVGVNGKGWLIKRGETVMVPRYVAGILSQSMEQDTAAARFMEQESARFEAETAARGLN